MNFRMMIKKSDMLPEVCQFNKVQCGEVIGKDVTFFELLYIPLLDIALKFIQLWINLCMHK